MNTESVVGSDTPTVPQSVVWGEVLDRQYVINTRGHHGVVVLEGMALDVMVLCRSGESSVTQLREALDWSEDHKDKLEFVLGRLVELEILEVNPALKEEYEAVRKSSHVKTYSVWLQITDDCNLRCPHCFVPKKSKHMDYETACSIIRKLSEDALRNDFQRIMIKLAGGEPTLNWDVASRVIERFTKNEDLGIDVRFSVITNGVFLPDDLVARVQEGSLGIALSLDGVGHWHDIQRPFPDGSGSFDVINASIERLLSADVKPFILTTVNEGNLGGLSELAEYVYSRDMGLRLSFCRGVAGSFDTTVSNEDLISGLAQLYDYMEVNIPDIDLVKYHRVGEINLIMPTCRNCGVSRHGIAVLSNGEYTLCPHQMSKTYGSVWEGCTVQGIRSNDYLPSEDTSVDNIDDCQDCTWKYLCSGGCPFERKLRTGGLRDQSLRCDAYKYAIPRMIDLVARQLITKLPERR